MTNPSWVPAITWTRRRASAPASSVVNSGARVGAGAIVNSGAVVEHDVSVGDFALLDSAEDVLLYRRSHGEEHLTVALNFARAEKTLELPPVDHPYAIVLSTALDRTGPLIGPTLTLRPNEGVILRHGPIGLTG